ncbi:RICIN domain-containing protein [Streptomyces sp. C184]|uniref:RICIN domain-containing protein n=1 Tax=Streptomyces sp. C184 TaxID=3237121 RepID=UPI0034C67750
MSARSRVLTALATGSAALGLLAGPAAPSSAASAGPQVQGASVRYVVNNHSGKCLTVQGASKANNATVNQYRCVGASNQQWAVELGGGDPSLGTLVLRNVNSGKCLTVHGGAAKGARLDQYDCIAGTNQSFSYLPIALRNTPLYAHPLTAKLAVDVQGASTADNAPVILWRDKHNSNQRWDITRHP